MSRIYILIYLYLFLILEVSLRTKADYNNFIRLIYIVFHLIFNEPLFAY